MAKDPVCGMEVDEKKALTTQHMGKDYYFCGPGCKKAFEQNPAAHSAHEGHSGPHH